MFGLRTKKQMTTKFSPFFLMFGREARYPFKIPEKYEINNTVEQVVEEETVTECIKHLDAIKEVMEANVTRSTTMTEKRLCLASRSVSFSVGELVLRQNVRSQQRKGENLEPNFLGPFKISAVQGKSADLISENGALFKNISIDHLKHFHPESVRIPHKITTQKTENKTTSPPDPPSTMSDTLSKVLKKVWGGTHKEKYVLLSKIGPCKLFCSDFARICLGQELESKVH
ncbi:PREDICTED: uncharacterized protein LOC106911799 [Poecilia mexicana]|uniref:uncharacterized protein LOC106911799 n=1 Tax=Poecilia mexicana TaxID=48701 RepID=UPI00072EB83D|nr:PREDICTED: uncharacterized protein LOC106911799 [Poecilia mexicana]